MNKKNILLFFLVAFILVIGVVYILIKQSPESNSSLIDSIRSVFNDEVEREGISFEYTTKEGDTLDKISEEYGLEVETILFANGLETGSELVEGQNLRIPSNNGLFVVVDEDDTLESIAQEYDVNSQDIADYNWLDYPYDLESGSELFIPKSF